MRRALTSEQIAQLGTQLPGWTVVEKHHLNRRFEFKNFLNALDFVNHVGAEAEKQGHHPDIYLTWGKVGIDIWTHDLNALSNKDIALAQAIDLIAQG